MPAAIMLAMVGAMALACFAKAAAVVFLGAPRTQAAEHAHDCGVLMRGPMLALAGVCVAIGLAPILFWPAISHAVGNWNSAWAGGELPAPITTLGSVQIALAILASAAGVWLWRKARVNGLRQGLTWDCGYECPTARMQYTSGSFSGIAAGWFGWLLQPERKLRRPRGPLPAMASHIERVPETVLERVMAPMGDAILRLSAATRRLQHGRLQFYILYVVAELIAAGALVFFGGRP
jgi:hydrogenase-4 component B